jgi:hypothetical protein
VCTTTPSLFPFRWGLMNFFLAQAGLISASCVLHYTQLLVEMGSLELFA